MSVVQSPIKYTAEEQQLIDKKLKSNSFTHNSWSDEELKDLKSRIKTACVKFQRYKCAYCKQDYKTTNGQVWAIEHIIPRDTAPSFMFEPYNLCASCHDCNNAKSNKNVTTSKAKKTYPMKNTLFSIVHPYLDIYEKNILMIKEGFYYVAIKSKGEKTISVCKLNRFYEYADFGASVDDDERILLLSEQLRSSSEVEVQKAIRKEIAALAIKGSA
ncbi:HNH endonuclease [Pseudoalteromonas obscura]|uniref:HNH endonuclease n=1 Tax=Pseudoalteromonas obscura TaxID=3048491 RepID=A0ABT7EJK1_9GAMM|nr:HNH endonuclease [Pseudoalteromonas sp. P94(2023)]MDK2595241.1 HNH endonuclease [Pseudoalteromonas sp. P94(2023)]